MVNVDVGSRVGVRAAVGKDVGLAVGGSVGEGVIGVSTTGVGISVPVGEAQLAKVAMKANAKQILCRTVILRRRDFVIIITLFTE